MPTYTPDFEAKIMAWARKHQTRKRFAHTQRVVETVTGLAEQWAPDQVMVCRLAAWIHDSAKNRDDAFLLEYALRYGVPVSDAERENPMLLHGIVAYLQASAKFHFHDDQIRTACAYHTTGSPHMNLVDKLLYLADLIEPEREFPSVEVIRHMARVDIDQAMLLSIDGTLRYLLARKRLIDPRMVLLYNALLRQTNGYSAPND